MNQFELARLKAEKRAERPVLTLPKKEEANEVKEPKPKEPKKRNNEIEVKIHVNGQEIGFCLKANVSGGLMASQINHDFLRELFKGALSKVLGAVE